MNENFTIAGLTPYWNFHGKAIQRWERRRSLETALRYAKLRPRHKEIKPVFQQSVWTVYFIHCPDGALTASHYFTLEQLRKLGFPILVVCATASISSMPEDINKYCEALYWKALPGYDFSGYTLALREISRRSSGADVFVMNDSVLGPFSDLRHVITKTPWDLTGFTATDFKGSHIQSYAFVLRRVNRLRMAQLSTVFFPCISFSDVEAVIALQEVRFARVAARHMTVGALWFGNCEDVYNPSLQRSIELIDTGFPFLKRSLVGKLKHFVDQDLIYSRLNQLGHPLDNI